MSEPRHQDERHNDSERYKETNSILRFTQTSVIEEPKWVITIIEFELNKT